jgi:hypothetical protein
MSYLHLAVLARHRKVCSTPGWLLTKLVDTVLALTDLSLSGQREAASFSSCLAEAIASQMDNQTAILTVQFAQPSSVALFSKGVVRNVGQSLIDTTHYYIGLSVACSAHRC